MKALIESETPVGPSCGSANGEAAQQRRPTTSSALRKLSPAQRRVLALIGQGYMTKEIAGVLGISYKGVQYHRGVIYRTLQINSLGEAVRVAIESQNGS